MTNEKLLNLTLLNIQSDLLREIEFDDILDAFPARKARKVHV